MALRCPNMIHTNREKWAKWKESHEQVTITKSIWVEKDD